MIKPSFNKNQAFKKSKGTKLFSVLGSLYFESVLTKFFFWIYSRKFLVRNHFGIVFETFPKNTKHFYICQLLNSLIRSKNCKMFNSTSKRN